MSFDKYITLMQAAKKCGKCYKTVSDAANAGRLQSITIAGYKFTTVEYVKVWLENSYRSRGKFEKYKSVTFGVEAAVYEKLMRIAKSKHVTIAAVMREATDRYLEGDGN